MVEFRSGDWFGSWIIFCIFLTRSSCVAFAVCFGSLSYPLPVLWITILSVPQHLAESEQISSNYILQNSSCCFYQQSCQGTFVEWGLTTIISSRMIWKLQTLQRKKATTAMVNPQVTFIFLSLSLPHIPWKRHLIQLKNSNILWLCRNNLLYK